jgi:ATP-dependent Lon protease
VLAIGGVKEKVLAAYRFGTTTIILPKENEKDLSDIPDDILRNLTIRLVENMDEVLEIALAGPLPQAPLGIERPDARIENRPAEGPVTH